MSRKIGFCRRRAESTHAGPFAPVGLQPAAATPAVPSDAELFVLPNLVAPADQGRAGACTGFSVGSIHNEKLAAEGRAERVSESFLYFNGRLLDALQDADAGAVIHQVCNGESAYGVAWASEHPYADTFDAIIARPSVEAYEGAIGRRAPVSYREIAPGDLATLEHTIRVAQLRVAFGSDVGADYEDFFDGSHPFHAFGPTDKPLGGHAQVIRGTWMHPELGRLWLVQTSWGAGGLVDYPGCAWYSDAAMVAGYDFVVPIWTPPASSA
jgi:hypothetical protein